MSEDKKAMSFRLDKDFHREIKVKLAKEDRKFSKLTRELLRKWVDGEIELED